MNNIVDAATAAALAWMPERELLILSFGGDGPEVCGGTRLKPMFREADVIAWRRLAANTSNAYWRREKVKLPVPYYMRPRGVIAP